MVLLTLFSVKPQIGSIARHHGSIVKPGPMRGECEPPVLAAKAGDLDPDAAGMLDEGDKKTEGFVHMLVVAWP